MVTLREFAEALEIETSGGYVGDAGIGRRPHVRRAATRFERRSFAHHTPGPDVTDNSSVHPYFEDPIENEGHRRGLLVLAKQEVSDAQLPNRWSFCSLHDLIGH
jgi:hypothetical protein